MKIALVTQDFPPQIGGIETYSFEIAKRLNAWTEDFVVICPDKPEAHLIDKELDFDVIRIPIKNTLIGYVAAFKTLPLLRERGIDIVFHAQWQTLFFSKRGKKRKIVRKVFTAVHARELFFNPFGDVPLLSDGYNRLMHRQIQIADYYFPVSRFTAGHLEKFGIDKEKIQVVNNGTDKDLFYRKETTRLKEKLGLTDKKIILTIARVIERKGYETCVRSLPYVIQKYPDAHYVVVGDGPFMGKLQRLVTELKLDAYVTFIGKVRYEETVDYYSMADVFAMPSLTQYPEIEAFGITYLEANACETPVIGSRTGGIADAILEGETGLLVEERNPVELSEAIIKLLDNPEWAQRLGKQGRKHVEEEANWDIVSRKIFDYIQDKAGNSGSG